MITSEGYSLSYEAWYFTGITTSVLAISWLTGKTCILVGKILERGNIWYKDDWMNQTIQWTKVLKKVGNTLTFPVDFLFVWSYVWFQMCLESIFPKDTVWPIEGHLINDNPDTIFPSSSDGIRLIFHEYTQHLPKSIRQIIHTSWMEQYQKFYTHFIQCDFDKRYDIADAFIENEKMIHTMEDIFLIIDACRAWIQHPELIHTDNPLWFTEENEEAIRSTCIKYLTPNSVRKAQILWNLSDWEANFLLNAEKNPGK